MKFCSIVPIKNTKLMYEQDYVMLLAHLSQKYPEYSKIASESSNYKIMDNSLIELGGAINMKELIKEAIKCKADEIILPDEYNDGRKTVEKVLFSIQWLKEKKLLGRFKLMGVCHGRNIIELWDCFNRLREIPELDVIGVPKAISSWTDRAREANAMSLYTDKKIHLLGCQENLNEIKNAVRVRSMDTCLPSLLTIKHLRIFQDRNGRKINLEKDEIKNKSKYKLIMKKINKICSKI